MRWEEKGRNFLILLRRLCVVAPRKLLSFLLANPIQNERFPSPRDVLFVEYQKFFWSISHFWSSRRVETSAGETASLVLHVYGMDDDDVCVFMCCLCVKISKCPHVPPSAVKPDHGGTAAAVVGIHAEAYDAGRRGGVFETERSLASGAADDVEGGCGRCGIGGRARGNAVGAARGLGLLDLNGRRAHGCR